MRAIREAFGEFEVPTCKSKNRRTRCVFCPSRGSNFMILDCDRIAVLRKLRGVINDCVVIEWHGVLHVAVVELKGRSYSPAHTMSQLAAGAGLIMEMLRELNLKGEVCYHLVVVAPRHRYIQRETLCASTIRVRGRALRIHTVRCGTRLSQVIARA